MPLPIIEEAKLVDEGEVDRFIQELEEVILGD